MDKNKNAWLERAVCPKYKPLKDIKKVQPTGALDLKSAFANNAIPADLAVIDSKFNAIDEPRSIVGRVRDAIDAEVQSRELSRLKKPEPKTE